MILAAGFGTRLGALSDERPKPLLPVADVPLILYAIALLRGAGVRDVVVNLHHRGDLIEEALAPVRDLRVHFSREEKILGTGGGIRRALALLGGPGGAPFFVMNGKIVFDLDLADVLARHRASGARATLVVKRDPDAARWGAIDAPPGGGPIRGFFGAGEHMFTGVHVIDPWLVARLPDDGEERCIVRQGYVPWLAEGVPIHAYEAPGYFMEHSTPERYLAGNFNVLRGVVTLRDAPGELTGVDPTATIDPTARVLPPIRIGPGAVIEADAIVGPDVVVGARSRVGRGVFLHRTVVWPDTRVTASATHAILTPRQRVVVKP
jgi:NDP-sugar pyrophosphorylase family protein